MRALDSTSVSSVVDLLHLPNRNKFLSKVDAPLYPEIFMSSLLSLTSYGQPLISVDLSYRRLLNEALKLSDSLPGDDKTALTSLCKDAEKMLNVMAGYCKKGQVFINCILS